MKRRGMHRSWVRGLMLAAALIGVAVTLLVHWLKRLRTMADMELYAVRDRFNDASSGTIPLHLNPALWADLPPFARRYLRYTVGDAHRMPRGVHLTVRGSFRPNPHKDDWWPLDAEQWVVPDVGFLWHATVRKGPLTLSGADWYLDGAGRQEFRLMNLIPVMHRDGDPDIDRSSLGRYLIELVMTPWAWLPSRGARWTTRKDRRVEVTLPGQDHPPVVLTVAADGRLQRAEILRWGEVHGEVAERVFFVEVRDLMRVDGWAIPRVIEAGWVDENGEDQAFYKADMVVV